MDPPNKITACAIDLVEKLRELQSSPDFAAVFTLYYIHGGQYTGPNFETELINMMDALEEIGWKPGGSSEVQTGSEGGN